MHKVTFYDANGNPAESVLADYVSLVNGNTYGQPHYLLPDARKNTTTIEAGVDEKILYVNTTLVPAFAITKGETSAP